MWLHIVLLAGTAILAVMVVLGKIPWQDVLSKREWKLLILLLAVGNVLGAYLTYTQNNSNQWKEDMYFEKNAAGRYHTEDRNHTS